MAVDAKSLWEAILPEVRKGVTGVGIWSALNATVPVAFEESQLVIGLPPEVSDLAGHLRLQQTKTLIERLATTHLGERVALRVIDGIHEADWETTKRRDQESLRLQEQAIARQRAEITARSSWDIVYDQISRKYAALPNKSMPQVRARFFEDCLELMHQSLKTIPIQDEQGERNFARCIERIATYADLPSTFVALQVGNTNKSS